MSSGGHEEGIVEDCGHNNLTCTSPPQAAEAGYKQSIHRPSATKRKRDRDDTKILYPAPLVLPGDELALDPRYPSQSVHAWQREKDRNVATPQRNVIYIAAVDEDAETDSSWTHPNLPRQQKQPSPAETKRLQCHRPHQPTKI